MLNRLLRRLQGRTTPSHRSMPERDDVLAPVAQLDADEDAPAGTPVDPAELRARGLRWLLDVPAVHATPEPGAADQALAYLTPLADRLDPRRLPRLPVLVPQLLAALRRDDTDAESLATLLGRDPTLAGDVMRIANSAFHRRSVPASSLVQAIAVLGADGLRHAVLTSVMRPILRPDARSAAAARLWELAEARTWFAARLAEGSTAVASAQLAAVVTSTGAGALLGMTPAAILVPATADPGFAARFEAVADAVTARAAQHWQLPDEVVDALRTRAIATGGVGGILRTADLLALARALARDGLIAPGECIEAMAGTVGSAALHRRLLAQLDAESSPPAVDSAA